MQSEAHRPTPEQQAALAAFATGSALVLEAGAGTGKTSTLQFLANAAPTRRGLYVAFNTAIANEARKKFPRNITVKTTHALAMAGTDFAFQKRLQSPKVPLALAASRLGINAPLHVGARSPVRPNTQAGLAMRTVLRFCSTSDREITKRHVPPLDGMTPEGHAYLASRIVAHARRVWADVSEPDGHLYKFEHDHYLKAWALQQPRWGFDFVLFDEAQDANPVVSSMVEDQVRYGAQVVAVGDAAQAIYGWRGAVDTLDTFKVEHRLRLTQSFRFGPAIAAEANKWLALLGTDMRLTSAPGTRSTVVAELDRPDAILCRKNATVIAELFRALSEGASVGLVGGGTDLLGVARAAEALMAGRPTEHPEFALFENWDDLVDYAESGADPNLSVLVKIVGDHGPGSIRTAVSRAAHEEQAELVLSTAHKAKGKEWGRVRLASDFAEPRRDKTGVEVLPERGELMLSYVAVTRAMRELDRGNLSWVDDPSWKRANDPAVRAFDAPNALATTAMSSEFAAEAAPASLPPRASQPAPEPTPAPYIAQARVRDPNAYAKWDKDSDQALLAGYEAGASLSALMAIFGRNEGAVAGRVMKLYDLQWGAQEVFDATGLPCLHAPPSHATGSSAPSQGRGTSSTARLDGDDKPDWGDHQDAEEPDHDTYEDERDQFAESREEQESILPTVEYLMARDDI